ncbi:hypothetical protein HAX54_037809, partial [Datura stramonium]|nr:hypothetical protein [Datura stramonium]
LEVEVFLVEVTLSTFNLAGPFRWYYKLDREAKVQVRLHEACSLGIQGSRNASQPGTLGGHSRRNHMYAFLSRPKAEALDVVIT